MRIHEAMLKGLELYPEAIHNTQSQFIVTKDDKIAEFCALGAAYLGAEIHSKPRSTDGEFSDYV